MVEKSPVIPDAVSSRIQHAAVNPPTANGTASPPSNSDAIDDDILSADDFRKSFGEDILRTLDVKNLRAGRDLTQDYSRIEGEVREAVHREDDLHREIRTRLFPRLKIGEHVPKNAGVHLADVESIKRIHHGLLFAGGVEAWTAISAFTPPHR